MTSRGSTTPATHRWCRERWSFLADDRGDGPPATAVAMLGVITFGVIMLLCGLHVLGQQVTDAAAGFAAHAARVSGGTPQDGQAMGQAAAKTLGIVSDMTITITMTPDTVHVTVRARVAGAWAGPLGTVESTRVAPREPAPAAGAP